jgi:hypothetical protein
VNGTDCAELARTFFQLPDRIQTEELLRSDIETRYAIYLCGNQYMRPATQYLAEPFARGGKSVADFLRSKLAQANDDLTVRDIVRVFEEMSRSGTYDVANDRELMQLISARAEAMKDAEWNG